MTPQVHFKQRWKTLQLANQTRPMHEHTPRHHLILRGKGGVQTSAVKRLLHTRRGSNTKGHYGIAHTKCARHSHSLSCPQTTCTAFKHYKYETVGTAARQHSNALHRTRSNNTTHMMDTANPIPSQRLRVQRCHSTCMFKLYTAVCSYSGGGSNGETCNHRHREIPKLPQATATQQRRRCCCSPSACNATIVTQ